MSTLLINRNYFNNHFHFREKRNILAFSVGRSQEWRYFFRILFYTAESFIDNDPVVAVMTKVSLFLVVRGFFDSSLYYILTFIDWISDGIFIPNE